MIGSNDFLLSEATMNQIVQEWIDKNFVYALNYGLKVKSVKYSGTHGKFEVSVISEPPKQTGEGNSDE